MSDPVRIYSPNPDAPQYVGMQAPQPEPQPWYRGLGAALMNAPNYIWGMLPPEARKAYKSGFNALVDMTTPAAVRDYTTAAQDTARSATQGDGWGTATNALATVNAALGAIPVAGLGIRAAQKGARDVGRVAGEGAQNFIRAYHGSPHDFDRFDLSKIGTGEGAQAYGHGLYFAENEGVAQGYKQQLSRRNVSATWDGRPIDNWASVVDKVQSDNWRVAKVLDEMGRVGGNPDDFFRQTRDWYRNDKEMMSAIDEVQRRATATHTPGRMYEVAIHADPAKFLDWDKPVLGTQANELLRPVDWHVRGEHAVTPGRDIYGDALDRMGPEQAVEFFKNAGIPGIKYLDQGSRAAGDGSRNYVVFDDKLIEILRKYGLLPFAGAAGYAAMPGQEQQPQGLF